MKLKAGMIRVWRHSDRAWFLGSFGEHFSGGSMVAVELMSDLLPLCRSGSFRLAFSPGN